MKTLVVDPRLDLAAPGEPGELVAFGVGPAQSVHAVWALHASDTRCVDGGGATFLKTRPDQPQAYRVRSWDRTGQPTDLRIDHEEFNLTHVQPMRGGSLLLLCGRCRRNGDAIEHNGRVYGPDARRERTLVLGDGIQHVHVGADDTIWVSYFDEGIFGNQSLGASGLVRWSATGEKLFEFQPPDGLDPMADCYAMNVDLHGDVWCCYYTGFPLVRIRGGRPEAVWQPSVTGAHALAVATPHALFLGGYDRKRELTLVELRSDGSTRIVDTYRICTADGRPLVAESVDARGPTIHLVAERKLYSIDIDACLR